MNNDLCLKISKISSARRNKGGHIWGEMKLDIEYCLEVLKRDIESKKSLGEFLEKLSQLIYLLARRNKGRRAFRRSE